MPNDECTRNETGGKPANQGTPEKQHAGRAETHPADSARRPTAKAGIIGDGSAGGDCRMTEKLEFPFYALPKGLAAQKDLQASDKVVFSVIRDYLNDNGTSWPGIRTLSKNTGLAFSTVIDSIQRLEAAQFLKVERFGPGKSSHYSIIESALRTRTVKRSENPNGQKTKALGNPNSGARKTRTEALGISEPTKTDLKNKTTVSTAFVLSWNTQDRLPKIKSVTNKRKEAFDVRTGEEQFAENWQQIIKKAAASDFLCGKNNRGWKIDIDWLLKNDTNYVKVLEGKYDNKPKSGLKRGDSDWLPSEKELDEIHAQC